jgi:hypothetical protein
MPSRNQGTAAFPPSLPRDAAETAVVRRGAGKRGVGAAVEDGGRTGEKAVVDERDEREARRKRQEAAASLVFLLLLLLLLLLRV